MCGISGTWGVPDDGSVEAMLSALRHRGPDGRGIHRAGGVALGACRMAVVDLAGGQQPASNEERTVHVVHNGEIYNHRELRRELEARGHHLSSSCDTELLPHLYEEHGVGLLTRLSGMFAFALWDERARRLLLARDQLGQKPLYYVHDGPSGRIHFGSELKSLLGARGSAPRLSLEGLDHYLSFRSIPAPATALEGIHSLGPGEALVVEGDRPPALHRWATGGADPTVPEEPEEIAEELRRRLEDSVRRCLDADVPAGVMLSGGIDSSLVAALAARHRERLTTFTLGFDDPRGEPVPGDERRAARRVARLLGCEHQERAVNGRDVLAALPRIVWAMDQPSGDGLQHYMAFEGARSHMSVALAGVGADELFAGYPWFRTLQRMERLEPLLRAIGSPARRALSRVPSRRARLLAAGVGSFGRKFAATGTLFSEEEKRELLHPELQGAFAAGRWLRPLDLIDELSEGMSGDPVEGTSHMLFRLDLPALLLRDADTLSMAHALEVRQPYLDGPVVGLARGIPSRLKLGPLSTKRILRRCAGGLLPPEVRRTPKHGFQAPLAAWLRHELRPLLDDLLSPESTRRRGLFAEPAVATLKARFLGCPREGPFRVWSLMVLEMWQRLYLDGADRVTGG